MGLEGVDMSSEGMNSIKKCSTVKEGVHFSSSTRPLPPYGGKSRGYSRKLGNTLGNYVTMLL